jgi:HD superfamily phosphodiesterase
MESGATHRSRRHTIDPRTTNAVFARIWEMACPYLNTRKNDIHTELSMGLAHELLEREGGDRDIVIPAIILHDVGWKSIPEDLQIKAFGPAAELPELNRIHEIESARIAEDLLRRIHYDRDKAKEIIEIIKGHDSRKEPLSLNDRLVKDADKLWRYSKECLHIDAERFNLTLREAYDRLRFNLDRWFLTDTAKLIAGEELANRLSELEGP